ncbi:MAG: hypothetical protein IJ527_10215 [Prevotella sp.]|nr:hypothetical protein [Prevotella sp.]
MKKTSISYKTLTFVLLFTLPLMAMTCDDDMIEIETFVYDESGIPNYAMLTTVTYETFNGSVVGKGWRQTDTMLINEQGQETSFQWSSDYDGPADLYFSRDSLFMFVYEKERNLLKASGYDYSQQKNLVQSPLVSYMQLLSVTEWQMKTVERIFRHGAMNIYVVNTYQPMTEHELNAHWLGFKAGED